MLQIGITGKIGFIGTHLTNYLNLFKDKYEVLPFEDSFFENTDLLQNFVKQCDVIVHLAGVNRNPDPRVIYDMNVKFANDLILALEKTNSTPHILFSSST